MLTTRTCPYPNCDQSRLSNDKGACPACGRPVYFMGGHDFTELIVDRTRDFTGRDWVFAASEARLNAHSDLPFRIIPLARAHD